ncbi:RHS repeat-associated core domain-containing protein, partial [Flavobacterium sp. NRK F7]|uniref:RHS repeat-associated core domain-containing protein n=1 Tax=Flavobacterium sp. NRK F7 TaxID=2954930 RepID=UPI002091B7B4
DILTKNYYDTYTYSGAPNPIPSQIEGQDLATNVKGIPTGSWAKVLDMNNPNAAETSYTLYDEYYRPVRAYTSNHLGGFTQVDSKLDWSGKTEYTITTHKYDTNATALTVRDNFFYTAQDRLDLHTQQINGGSTQLIAKNTYDELGQLTSKNVGGTGTTGLQTVDYKYNIRGWLKEINDVTTVGNGSDLFAFRINYNDYQSLGTHDFQSEALYNGNISGTYWKSKFGSLKKYNYSYDDLNRLTEATYLTPNLTTNNGKAYDESLSYDKNGNIQTLERNGGITTMVNPIDDLVYIYDTNNKNLLVKVSDATTSPQGFNDGANNNNAEYGYDVNGNMTRDDNKGITNILYNHLNLPTEIVFGTNKIEYLYNATGQKVVKKVTESTVITTTTYLAGGFQYENSVLQFFPQAEGYVKKESSSYKYVFNYTDHLGNIRLSYKDADSNGTIDIDEIVEENEYYPFGLKHNTYPSSNAYQYKYNGKELQDELGLNFYDYGARNYDPALGRWMNIDPLAEQGRRWSPYNYAMDNPVFFIDPDGMLSQSFIDRISSSASGTTWVNTGNETFTDGESEIDENGDPKKKSTTGTATLKAIGNTALDIFEQVGIGPSGELYKMITGNEILPRFEVSEDEMVEYYSAMIILAIIEPGPGGEANLAKQLTKIQKHHVIPKAVYKKLADKLGEYMKLNGGFNLKKLPTPFHGNHPQYNDYVMGRIEDLIRNNKINETSIKSLQKELSTMINSAYDNYKKTGQNLNDYFKIINGAN